MRVTKRKQVWLMVIARDIALDLVPAYCTPLDVQTSRDTEVLALHLRRVQQCATTGLCRMVTRSFHQPRPVTWVRMVHGLWVLVACSDALASVLTLRSVRTVLSSSLDRPPVAEAEAYFSGPIDGGEVNVEGGTLAIALDIRSLYDS